MGSTVVLDIIHDYVTPWPRIVTDGFIMTTGSARPMEDALRIARTTMVHWIAELTGMPTSDSYQVVSQASLTPAANAVDTNYTVVCKIARTHLKGASVYCGMHDDYLKAL